MTNQEKLLSVILAKVANMDLVAGANGTIKLNTGDTWFGSAKAVCFSEDATITTMNDSNGNTKIAYFTSSTYNVKAGDIFVAHGMNSGARLVALEVSAGTGMIVL
jgi:hypothetical protein